MKVAVVGAGAMGTIFGARLHDSGAETVLVDVVEPLVEKINADGVTVVRGDEEVVSDVRATTDPASVGVVDAVVFFVKCYHTAAAAENARPLVGEDTVVASLQNGWGNGDVLAAVYPPEQVVVGVTYNSGTVLAPARVAHPGVGPTYVGAYADGSTAGAERLAEAIRDSGLDAQVTEPIRPEIWKKLILNAATLPTAALTGMNAGALTEHAAMRDLVSETAREATAVARALGYDIDAEERVEYTHALLGRAGPTRGSMLQDFEAGRQTEVDVINGAVVRAADEQNVPVPINRAFVALVKGWERMHGLGAGAAAPETTGRHAGVRPVRA
jgi:2-dehydropantoate 2-reductase